MMRIRTLSRTVSLLALLLLPGLARASNYALEDIPQTIPTAEAAKLKAAGVPTTFALLEKGGSATARKGLAKQTKIAEKTLEAWIQLADLLRVRGIGPDVARLLTAAGTKTVDQLKKADATKLNDEIAKVNSKQHLSENPPSLEHLQAWIKQAESLPIVLK
jgi:predicted flap endonuclease-1-like 5' DNA nuclease